MKKRLLLIFIIFLACLIGIYYYFREQVHAKSQQISHTVTVAAARVQQQDETVYLQTIGTVQPVSTVSLKSLVDGQVLAVNFKEGDLVRAGQVLFQIDPRPFQVQLQRAEANLAKDQAQLANARLALQRNAKLLPQGYIAKQDFEQLRANTNSLAATVKADQAAIAGTKLQLNYCKIQAPISGRTGNVLVQVGNLVKANDTNPLVTINQLAPIYVVFSVPEQQLTAIYQAFADNEIIPVMVNKDKLENNYLTGKLSFIDNTVNTATGTIQLKAIFENIDHKLWPGQFVNVKLPIAYLKQALVVPTQAVQAGPSGNHFVYIIGPDHKARMQVVTIGPLVTGGTVITQGLKAGELIITEGQLRVQEGATVQIAEVGKQA